MRFWLLSLLLSILLLLLLLLSIIIVVVVVVVVVIFQLRQAAIIKRAILRSTRRSDYLITGRYIMALWHCGEPTCTWTVAAWRLHIPFSLGITVVFSLSADVSQMACYRINCKVALNWSVALSHVHLLCRIGYLLLEPHWSPYTHRDTSTHPPTERSILARCIVAHKRGELY